MKIAKLVPDQYDAFFKFNKKIYPARKDVEKRFQFQLLDNPLLEDKSSPNVLIAYSDDNKIIGQFLLNPGDYHFAGKLSRCFSGCDYFVLQNYRKTSAGAMLAFKGIYGFKPYFVIGVSKEAKNISLSLDTKIIGNMYKFIWFRKVLSFVRLALNFIGKKRRPFNYNEVNKVQFPEILATKNAQFRMVHSLEEWEYRCWSDAILEFSRSLEFLNWRFLSKQKKYHFYLLHEKTPTTYFVIRRLTWRGLNLLAIIDYRVPFEDQTRFNLVLKASKRLARLGKYDGILTNSSHRFFDNGLKNSLFIKMGKPSLILTNAEISTNEQRIDKRDFIYSTMADADVDFNY